MKYINDPVNKLIFDINLLKIKIENRSLYNSIAYFMRFLIKGGDSIAPYILATIISFSLYGVKTFRVDDVVEKASVEIIDTSSDIHFRRLSYDYSYDTEKIEHSTGWVINDKGLFERTVTSYRLNNNIDLYEAEKILAMTKEEIENILDIANIETVEKPTLTKEDLIYDSDAVIVVNHFESEDEYFVRKETFSEVFNDCFLFALSVLLGSLFIKGVTKFIIKVPIGDRLKLYEIMYQPVCQEQIETLEKILKLKQENLALLDSDTEEVGHSYKLRKW